ncbi:hypothetical protein JCM6882_006012 [Rhodosporidiobolus microsporus]
MKLAPRPPHVVATVDRAPSHPPLSLFPFPFPSSLHLSYLFLLLLLFLLHLPLLPHARNDVSVGPRWSALPLDLKVVLAFSRRASWADVVLRPERCSAVERMLYEQKIVMAGRVLVLNACFFHRALWRSPSWPKSIRLAFPRRFRSRHSSPVPPPTSLEIFSFQLSLLSSYLLPPLAVLLTLSGRLSHLTFTIFLLLHSAAWVVLPILFKLYALARGEKMRTWRKLVRNSLFSGAVVVVSFS